MCLRDMASNFLNTSDLQFGFKKGLGCADAILTARLAINYFVDRGSTVTICALDISKAFDKVDFYVLFLTLMSRGVPKWFINIIITWYSKCSATVRWEHSMSARFKVQAGVRQGGILSPSLFSVYIDCLIMQLKESGCGMHLNGVFVGCICYADDILLISCSVCDMQRMLDVCSVQAQVLNIKFNARKCMCMRFGARYMSVCKSLVLCGDTLNYVAKIKYLGVELKTGRRCTSVYDSAKLSFYRCFNAVYAKTKAAESELISMFLLRSVCLPIVTYALEASGPSRSCLRSLDNVIDNAVRKIFNISDVSNVKLVREMMRFPTVENLYRSLACCFIVKFWERSLIFSDFIARLAFAELAPVVRGLEIDLSLECINQLRCASRVLRQAG
jgi:hypothetical protein